MEWEGGNFFQMKGKGRDRFTFFLGKTKKNEKKKTTELDYMVRMSSSLATLRFNPRLMVNT